MLRNLTAAALIAALLLPVLTAQEVSPGESSSARRNMIEMRALDAEILPSWEIILPTGYLEIRGEDSFGGLELDFRSYFNFIDNTLGAGVAFAYPVWLLVPRVRFFQDVDFESTVDVDLTGSVIRLNENSSYISRQRGFETGVELRPVPWLGFGPTFGLVDSYEGDIEASQILDDDIYLLPGFGFSIDTLSLADLNDRIYTGFEMESRIAWRFREEFSRPVDSDLTTSLSIKSGWENDLYMNTRFSFGLPLQVWEEQSSRFYTLGGVESVHGYQPSEIPALRYALLNGELKLPASIRRTVESGRERRLRVRRLRVLLVGDVAAVQEEHPADSPMYLYGGAGIGASILFGGQGNRYFRTRAYIAVPLQSRIEPTFYLETSLFSLSGSL